MAGENRSLFLLSVQVFLVLNETLVAILVTDRKSETKQTNTFRKLKNLFVTYYHLLSLFQTLLLTVILIT